jgi:hypothetical protein
MADFSLEAVGRRELGTRPISARLRSQIVYFMSAGNAAGEPALGDNEYWIAESDVAKWLDEGVFYLVSPLDSANQTEVELTEEQEALLEWLKQHHIQHIRVID